MEQRLRVLQSKSVRERAYYVAVDKINYLNMKLVFISILLVVGAWGDGTASTDQVAGASEVNEDISETELMLAFVMFRHGDRTPDQEELDLYPGKDKPNSNIFFPYGMKALTNKGKQRGYSVGKYLRKQYEGFISPLYLPDDISVRTTSYSRTKMTALTALAALYPPLPAQEWNPGLNWQPVPYNTVDYDRDDLMYWYNCPLYIKLRNEVYDDPQMIERLKPYQEFFEYLQKQTGKNITTPEEVFYMDNLFQTLDNVGVSPPAWAKKRMTEIQEVTKIEYAAEFFNTELIRLASGVLLDEILNATSYFIAGDTEQPKLRLYSAHENNVAGFMAASRVFEPHQPRYGSTYAVELRRKKSDEEYIISAVYSENAGGPGKILPIKGCGSGLCNYNQFVDLVKDYAWTRSDFNKECKIED